MKQVLVQLDDATAAQLEKVAPGSSRKRSEFLRGVIARALHETLELETRRAYEKWPDEARPAHPAEWAASDEAVRPRKPRARSSKVRKKAGA